MCLVNAKPVWELDLEEQILFRLFSGGKKTGGLDVSPGSSIEFELAAFRGRKAGATLCQKVTIYHSS